MSKGDAERQQIRVLRSVPNLMPEPGPYPTAPSEIPPDDFTERLLNDFVFADTRLGGCPGLRALVVWLDSVGLVSSESAPARSFQAGFRLPSFESIAGYVFQQRTAASVAEIRYDDWFLDRLFTPEAVTSVLSVPLFDANRAVGVLNLECLTPHFLPITTSRLHSFWEPFWCLPDGTPTIDRRPPRHAPWAKRCDKSESPWA